MSTTIHDGFGQRRGFLHAVLFPAFRDVGGGAAYRELGEQFEEQEHARFGEHGFAGTVADIPELEAAFGIHDLAGFTAP